MIDLALEHPRYVVVRKPAGVLSVPGIGPGKTDCVIARVRAHFPAASGPMIVHRLDTDTAGLMIVALDPASQRHLSMQFEARTVHKAYTLLVEPEGWAASASLGDSIDVTLPMRPERKGRPYQTIDVLQGRPAETLFTLLERHELWARVRAEPHTGRTHQIRVHAAHPGGLNAPLIGDILYNPRLSDLWPWAPRMMLHASEIEFNDPDTMARVRVCESPDF
jgi:tRNA pseudouridine32 synthase/23S rRNA pseudouridine746 synthase